MRITFNRQSLADALRIASGVIPSRTTREALRFAKIDSSKSGVMLSATNAEQSIEIKLAGEVGNCPAFLVPVDRLLKIVGECSAQSVEIEVAGDKLTVCIGRSEFRLQTMPVDEFPLPQAFKPLGQFMLSSDVLHEHIGPALKCVDVQSTRYALGGVLLHVDTGKLSIVATDSRRLYVGTAEIGVAGEFRALIPEKAASLLRHMTGEVEVEVTDNAVRFTDERLAVETMQVGGKFPEYQKAIASSGQITAFTLPSSKLSSSMRQAIIMTTPESMGVDVSVDANKVTLSAKSSDVGQAKIEIELEHTVPEGTARIDPRYILDAICMCKDEAVKVELIGEQVHVVPEGRQCKSVIMCLAKE
jgi:DNA polymerase-3 subunit beta